MLLRCPAWLLLMSLAVVGDDITLSRVGDVWRYLPTVNEASTPLEAWRNPGFDDSAWLTGQSGFASGYIQDGATHFPDSKANYSAAYFRRVFVLADAAQIGWLTFRISYEDGFVAYLNGVEVARRNLAGATGTPVPYDQVATNFHACGEPEQFDLAAFRQALVSGTNLLAIQVHGMAATGPDLCLSAELMANFNRAPFLQSMSTNRVQIIWKTPVPADTRVEFGRNSALESAYADTNLVTTHVASLTGLAPDTSYQYRVSSSDGRERVAASVASFRTFKISGPVSFMVFGDGGWNSLEQYELATVLERGAPDFVLEVGDIVYPSFTARLADARCFSAYGPHMATTPYFFALGNHDLFFNGVTNYLDAFYLPTNSVSLAEHVLHQTSPEHYYSFDAGDGHFVVLFVPYLSQYQLTVGDPQYNWLVQDLAQTRQPWKIVFCHVPMNSSSQHRFDDTNGNGLYDRLEIRQVLLPVLSQYGVQLVCSGHEHGYERFNPTNGVHFITTAGGGADLYGFTELDFASSLFWIRYNCLKVTIQGDTLEAQALGTDGLPFDAMTIQRRLPPPQVYQSAWSSPIIESSPSDDGDGNISGQRFDFAGDPIPTLTGQFSNLGRVYVNNDQTNLYVGLERVMIYGNNNIFLFLESPHLVGVSNLVNLGNGIVDPSGEGADGLDFLSNLSFTNFHPSVGCILGDEFADSQFRSFARRNLPLNIGQGAFKLAAGLPDIPGFRLQQFHLSPQIMSMPGEENANFIKLAIPLAELGGLQPGETVRVGAVVAGEEFDLQQQTRLLDSGFLGQRLVGSGQSEVVLEGMEVHTSPGEIGLRLTTNLDTTAGTLRISWSAVAGQKYQVQAADRSISEFHDVPGAEFQGMPSGADLIYAVDLAKPDGHWRFYRVKVVP